MNALKHGLTANNIVLTMENREEFEALRQSFLDQLQPTNQIELDLVDQMVSAHWRLDRMLSLETASLDLELVRGEQEVRKTFDEIDDDSRLAVAFKNLTDNSNNLAIISRYESRFRRNYERALRLLYEIRGTPLRPAQPVAATPKPAPPPPEAAAPQPPPAPSLPAPAETPMSAAPAAPDAPSSTTKIRMPIEPNPIFGHSVLPAARPRISLPEPGCSRPSPQFAALTGGFSMTA